MADDIDQRLIDAIKKLEEKEPGGNIVIFTATEAAALAEVAKWWIALSGARKIGGALGAGVKWMAMLIGAWLAIKAGFFEWIAQNLGGSK